MVQRASSVNWEGSLQDGKGLFKLGKGEYSGDFTFSSRFEDGLGTGPEELIAAGYAACFTMTFSQILAQSGYNAENINTNVLINIMKNDHGYKITKMALNTDVLIAEVTAKNLQQLAEKTKEMCPIAKLLCGADIEIAATLQ